jgi:hypothetical protein
MAIFRLDYLSCFLTVVTTVLLGRKMWIGFVVSGINSLIVCVIGLHTSQYGFIPANLFCICINAFNVRAWLKVQKDPCESTTDTNRERLTGCKRLWAKSTRPQRILAGVLGSIAGVCLRFGIFCAGKASIHSSRASVEEQHHAPALASRKI